MKIVGSTLKQTVGPTLKQIPGTNSASISGVSGNMESEVPILDGYPISGPSMSIAYLEISATS